MSLLDNLDKLTIISQNRSYIQCQCPVCQGSKLKISLNNKAYGAYRCYDNYCEPSKIREVLGIQDTKNYHLSPYRINLQSSVYTDSKLISKIESAKPVYLSEETILASCTNYSPIQSITREFIGGSKKKTTIYDYSSHQRVYRLDSYNPPDKKQIYLQYLESDGSWQVGVGEHTWHIYDRGIDFTSLDGNSILMVEGEKTAEFVKENYGLACITAAAPCFVLDYLYKILFTFFAKHKAIKQIIYVPDHDDPGYLKAEKVQKVCWYLKKACQIVPVKDYLNLSFEPEKGADLADFVPENNLEKIENV